MAQFQHMDACLSSLTDDMCQMNTSVNRIARQQAHLGGFIVSPSPSLEALANEDDDVGDDVDEDASSSHDDEMTTSQ